MTPAEILALERELAELLGWTGVREAPARGTLEPTLFALPPVCWTAPHVEIAVPRFARDIEAAWPAVETFRMSVQAPGAPIAGAEYTNGDDWTVEFDTVRPQIFHADTAPLAIALAARAALRAQRAGFGG